MREEAFEVAVPGGVLRGHRGGTGPPALLLHGGAAVDDYMDGCARELEGLVSTYRYTQRGTQPSGGEPPYTIENHLADALAVLDAFGVERAWAIGHSWGAHLALHLLVTSPERLLGVVCIDPLGAYPPFDQQDEGLRRVLTDAQTARVEEIEALRRREEATEADLLERFRLIWPQWFVDPANAPPTPVTHVGPLASSQTNASIAEHFQRGTLVEKLPDARLPALFVHGEGDVMPLELTRRTAALIPGARVVMIPNCGHFPWLERPGVLRPIVKAYLAEV